MDAVGQIVRTVHNSYMRPLALLLATVASLMAATLLSQKGPTFRVNDSELKTPLTWIAYGDQRFTDPSNVTSTNPRVRKWLVGRIAQEKPDAVVLNGDVPLAGSVKHDYEVFHAGRSPGGTPICEFIPRSETTSFTGIRLRA